MTLIELMVALFLGMLIIGMGLATILISRNLAATTTDVSALQQQAAYAFRVLGEQIRQAGSPELDLGLTNVPLDRVAFLIDYDDIGQILSGGDDNEDDGYFKVGYRNYTETLVDPDEENLLRDCLGEKSTRSDNLVLSSFKLRAASDANDTGRLVCRGSNDKEQEIIRNVGDFQVQYLQQSNTAMNQPTLKRVSSTEAADFSGGEWSRVVAVEVCLDMVGDERINLPEGAEYQGCSGDSQTYDNRTHMVFKNLFQIRSQGLVLDQG